MNFKRNKSFLKIFISVFLIVTLVISSISILAFAADTESVTISTKRDSKTGRSYNYINIKGYRLVRNYFDKQEFSADGSWFIVGKMKEDGSTKELYKVVISEGKMYKIDDCVITDELFAVVGPDDMVYYLKNDKEIWKYNSATGEKSKFLTPPSGRTFNGSFTISNDSRYMLVRFNHDSEPDDAADGSSNWIRFGRYDTETDTWALQAHTSFLAGSQGLTHMQINPEYPNLASFAHEGSASLINNRINVMDYEKGIDYNLFVQGMNEDGTTNEACCHELWSHNGENMYFVKYNSSASNGNTGIARVSKDGIEREYFFDGEYSIWHCYVSNDERWIVGDTNTSPRNIVLCSTETYEKILLAEFDKSSDEHPYQPHPSFSSNGKYIMWQQEFNEAGFFGNLFGNSDKRLGVSWMNVSDLISKTYNGGRTAINNDFNLVSYSGFETEVAKTVDNGETVLTANKNKGIYLDIDDDKIRTQNGEVTIKFDYLDNSTYPINVTYTRAYRQPVDFGNVEDKTISVSRTNTNSWKTATITTTKANMANAVSYKSDIILSGGTTEVKIKNLQLVSVVDYNKGIVGVVNYIKDGETFIDPVTGGFQAQVEAGIDGVLICAAYDASGKLIDTASSGAKTGNTLTTGTINLDTLDGVTVRNYIWNNANELTPVVAPQEERKINISDYALIDNSVNLLWRDTDSILGKDGYKLVRNGDVLDTIYDSNAAYANLAGFKQGDKVRVAAVNDKGEILSASNEVILGANVSKPTVDRDSNFEADFSEYTGVFNPTSEDELSTARWDGMVRTTVGPVKAGWDVAVYRGNTMKYTESGTTISHPNDGWSYNVPAKSWYDGTEDQHDNAGVWYWDDAEKAIYTHAYYRGTKTKIDYYDRAELWLNLGEMYENGDDILLTFEYKGGLRKIRSEHPGSSTLNNENNWATSIEFGTGNNGKTSNDWRPVTAYLPNLAINSTGPTSKEGGKGDIWLYGGMDGFWIKNIKVINITKAREAGLKYAELDMENSPIEFADDKENGVVVTYNDDYESAVRARAYFLKYSETPISFNDGAFTANYYKADKGDTGYMVKPIDGINALFTTGTYGDGVSAISGTTGTAARRQTAGKLPISVTDGLFKDTPNIRVEVDFKGDGLRMNYVNSAIFGSAWANYQDIEIGDGWKTRVFNVNDAQFAASEIYNRVAVDYGYAADKHCGWGDARGSFVLQSDSNGAYIKAIRVMSSDFYSSNMTDYDSQMAAYMAAKELFYNATKTQD